MTPPTMPTPTPDAPRPRPQLLRWPSGWTPASELLLRLSRRDNETRRETENETENGTENETEREAHNNGRSPLLSAAYYEDEDSVPSPMYTVSVEPPIAATTTASPATTALSPPPATTTTTTATTTTTTTSPLSSLVRAHVTILRLLVSSALLFALIPVLALLAAVVPAPAPAILTIISSCAIFPAATFTLILAVRRMRREEGRVRWAAGQLEMGGAGDVRARAGLERLLGLALPEYADIEPLPPYDPKPAIAPETPAVVVCELPDVPQVAQSADNV
ncbi:uncharacterized protein EV422DRAFT_277788 [Fimicolochytrium jonesii]|uniref:uncharacterized protein n=1 Tax=Fimicolochytrium jonesii TaxID=1396493 RepID=UPI0022FE3A57|nr:uncharacterized protein EV422DRAFT_277788 [Fimicolochytrium jonesii]KAI8816752.1 hypothetical protein EV422DRAFT_277788 [Fimicolochytrium jonesii]